MKDNFSKQSSIYAQFRPGYPPQLFDFLFKNCQNFDCAWDCATGNGQIATHLAERFKHVDATDISENQLKNATQKPNIQYRLGQAEAPDFPAHRFDLITVGQAAHWFDFERFYPEVRRIIKPGGLLALVGYNLLRIDPATEKVIDHFYHDILAGCWDAERHWVEESYTTLPFPFPEIPLPEMYSTYNWNLEQLLGYLGTWSAVQHFIQKNGHHPIDEALIAQFKAVWPENMLKPVRFPIFARLSIVPPA